MDKKEKYDYLVKEIDDANLDLFAGHSIEDLNDKNFKLAVKLIVDRLKLADKAVKLFSDK